MIEKLRELQRFFRLWLDFSIFPLVAQLYILFRRSLSASVKYVFIWIVVYERMTIPTKVSSVSENVHCKSFLSNKEQKKYQVVEEIRYLSCLDRSGFSLLCWNAWQNIPSCFVHASANIIQSIFEPSMIYIFLSYGQQWK